MSTEMVTVYASIHGPVTLFCQLPCCCGSISCHMAGLERDLTSIDATDALPSPTGSPNLQRDKTCSILVAGAALFVVTVLLALDFPGSRVHQVRLASAPTLAAAASASTDSNAMQYRSHRDPNMLATRQDALGGYWTPAPGFDTVARHGTSLSGVPNPALGLPLAKAGLQYPVGLPHHAILPFQMQDTIATVAQVAVLAGTGFVVRWLGIIDKDSTKALGKLTVAVFLPCLLLTQLASLSVAGVMRGKGVPLGLFVLIAVGWVFGAVASKFLKVPSDWNRGFTVGCAFGNGTSLAIILVSAVVTTSQALIGRYTEAEAIGVLALALPVQHILMWLVGYNYVKGAMFPQSDTMAQPTEMPDPQKGLLPSGEQSGEVPALATQSPLVPKPPAAWAAAPASWFAAFWKAAKPLLNPPIVAIIIGLTIAFVPPLHKVWVAQKGPLTWLSTSLTRLGQSVVPISMITLGSNIYEGPGKKMDRATIAVMFAIRQLVMPLFGVALAVAFSKIGIFASGDALPPLVLMILGSAPTANNIIAMCTALSVGAVELSTCTFWQYLGFLGLQLMYIPLFLQVALSL